MKALVKFEFIVRFAYLQISDHIMSSLMLGNNGPIYLVAPGKWSKLHTRISLDSFVRYEKGIIVSSY